MKKFIDINLLKYLTAFYSVTVLISLVKKIYFKTEGISYTDMTWYKFLTYNIFLDWVVVIGFMIGVAYLTKRMFDYWDWTDWKKIVAVHLFFSFFIGYFIFISISVIGILSNEMSLASVRETISFTHFMEVIELNFLIYFSMIGIIHVYYYIERVKQIEQQKSKLEAHLANSKLNVLRAQIQPHFIFNTLNSISSLIEIDKEKSQNLIADFGDLLRDILASNDKHLIPLSQELKVLAKYMAILDVRFSDHLKFNAVIEDKAMTALIPHMILQPLVENAVKHGYSIQHTELEISIEIKKLDDILQIKILNNGVSLRGSLECQFERGTGLSNTRDRLVTQYGEQFEMDLRNNGEAQGVEVSLTIPYQV